LSARSALGVMSMSERAFLDFYDTLSAVPVNQAGAGSEKHFCQRSALYRTLGLTPLAVKARNVLEVGPGSGDNALHIASWKPNSIHFIDGAKASIASVQARIDQGLYGEKVTIEYRDVTQAALSGNYDVILCEGLIPGQRDPEQFVNHLLPALSEGGVCVITTVSSVSYLAEICRRVLLPIIQQHVPEVSLVESLVKFFKAGLDSLTGMSRKPEDWVLDNIIHPWTDKGLFSIEEAVNALPNGFSILGSSPAFLQDWRWYKQFNEQDYDNKQAVNQAYYDWSSYLLDYRVNPQQKFTVSQHQTLQLLCDKAMAIHDNYRQNNNETELDEFINVLRQIKEIVVDKMPETAASIEDFISAVPELLAGNLQTDLGCFHQWFGRGQQYISIIRDV